MFNFLKKKPKVKKQNQEPVLAELTFILENKNGDFTVGANFSDLSEGSAELVASLIHLITTGECSSVIDKALLYYPQTEEEVEFIAKVAVYLNMLKSTSINSKEALDPSTIFNMREKK